MSTPDRRTCGHGDGLRIDCAACASLILRLPICGCGERLCPPGRGKCAACGAASARASSC